MSLIERKQKVLSKYGEYLADNFKDEMLKSMYVLLLPVLALQYVEKYFADEIEENFEEVYEQIFMINMFHYTSLEE